MRWNHIASGAAFALLLQANATAVLGQPRTTQASSILFFPFVVASEAEDTRLDLDNSSSSTIHLRCFYLNGTLLRPDAPEGPGSPRSCQEADFLVRIAGRRGVSWLASEGYEGSGFTIPPVVSDFRGALTCVEIDSSGAPVGGNHASGSARPIRDADVARYGAIGLRGTELVGITGNTLPLGGNEQTRQYDGCPALWRLDHFADGAESPSIGAGSTVRTELAMVPCSMDYETQVYPSFSVEIVAINEFEQQFVAETEVGCWFDSLLSDIDQALSIATLGTDAVQTTLRPAGEGPSGFAVVAHEIHESPAGLTASAAVSAHAEGTRPEPDILILP